MIVIGENCQLGNIQFKRYKNIKIGNSVKIGNGVVFDVTEHLEIGDRTIIGDNTKISGRYIKIGRECWIDENVFVGGGSCFEKTSELVIGDLVHLGRNVSINTARKITIGDEVGIGEDSKLYTHGAYLSFLKSYPVKFGEIRIDSEVWLPKAIVLPNVHIGSHVVVAAGSIITKSLPANCLAVGIPTKVVKENCYPKQYTRQEYEELIATFIRDFRDNILTNNDRVEIRQIGNRVFVGSTLFDLGDMKIEGQATTYAEKFKNELRRYGVRFKYFNDDGVYKAW